MKETWRWFGPSDPISIADIRQTGASGVVSALHDVPTGQAWSVAKIRMRQKQVEAPNGVASGLTWDVVESVPVSEAIKTQTGPVKEHLKAYKESIRNLAASGIYTVCYNFMPVLDWTRTDLSFPLPNGGSALRFDLIDFVVFDCFILERRGAAKDYSEPTIESARSRFAELSDHDRRNLSNNIVAGLPGANNQWSIEAVTQLLNAYDGMSPDTLRSNLIDFLSEVIPVAEDCGVKLCCHPDDPPFPLLGLPRVMSSQSDYARAFDAVDSPANGATLCTGSLGVAEDFDPLSFINEFGHRIHFAHLRNTVRDVASDGYRPSFTEAEHLAGDTDMVAVVSALMREETRRREQGRPDHEIPMRPDHGHALLRDRDHPRLPGYPLVGRLRGLAELRGVMATLKKQTDIECGCRFAQHVFQHKGAERSRSIRLSNLAMPHFGDRRHNFNTKKVTSKSKQTSDTRILGDSCR